MHNLIERRDVQAQGIKTPITTLQQLLGSDHRLYVLCSEVRRSPFIRCVID
jgi:hypothetical protein